MLVIVIVLPGACDSMDNVVAIGVGLALRAVIDILTDSDYRLTGTLMGLWEGFVLSHFLHKNPRNPNDAYLALATRFAIDFMLTNSLVRLALTGAWTLVGLLLADVAPSVWRETGLRHVYRALRKDVKAMRRAMPRWRIENDINVPNISISNPVPGLFSRPPASSIVSSTRAAPPASPAPILQRRSPLGSPSGQATSSVTNTLTREVLLGPSPAFIHIDVDPDLPPFDSDLPSHRTTLLSNSSDSDPSRHDTVPIPDDNRVHTTVPSHMEEQQQEEGPELSVLDLAPPVAAVEIISPTPLVGALPLIPDSEIDLSVHAPLIPPLGSRPASRVKHLVSTIDAGMWSQNARGGVGEVGSCRGPDLGNAHAPFHQQASSAGVLGQAQNQPNSGNQPNSTGHQASSRWEHSRLRHSEGTILSDGAAGIGGFAIQASSQMPQRFDTPQTQSGSGGVCTSSTLVLSTPPYLSETPATLPYPTPASAPQTKLPTPAPLINQTALAPHPKSSTVGSRSNTPAPAPAPALPPKTLIPTSLSRTHTPMPRSKTPTHNPKSRCTSPDLTSTSVRNPTDYDPANPIRPMPGLKSPSTEPDPIFPDTGAHDAPATGEFNVLDTSGADIYDDPPPPFKEFESPIHPRGANFGAGVDDGKRPGGQVVGSSRGEGAVAERDAEGEGQDGVAKGEGDAVITNENFGDVDDVGGQEAGEGTKEKIETSQGTGDHARGTDCSNREGDAPSKVKDSQEQEKSKEDGKDNQETGNESQATCEDAKIARGDTQIAGSDTQDADPALTPEPTRLTPDQKEAETHRHAFLLKEVARLEESRAQEIMDSPDEQDISKIQARLSVVKARISRTIFADPPRLPPPAFEVPSAGKNAQEFTSALMETIVDLLLERQDAGPIKVTVPYTKNKQKPVEKLLKEFNAENNFSIRSETGQLSTVIIV